MKENEIVEVKKTYKEMIKRNKNSYVVYCPICKKYFQGSTYLITVFEKDKILWLANMITHYRHTHITSWNKCWGYGGGYYRQNWFGDYDTEKQKVNERAKRQIIRKCTEYLKYYGFTTDDFLKLQNTTEETVNLANKVLVYENN
jgi:hypothetical protein